MALHGHQYVFVYQNPNIPFPGTGSWGRTVGEAEPESGQPVVSATHLQKREVTETLPEQTDNEI